MSEPIFLSLKDQCEALHSGRLTSSELTEKYIQHINLTNQDLNIVIKTYFSEARKRSRELDSIFKSTGRISGPLHGIPFTIKDAFRIKNFSTSYGFPSFNLLPSFDNCTLVDRLISAGAIFLGQTNVPLSCFDWQTNSPIYGLTKNPLNPMHTVGGSSGGAAASVAAFYSAFEVGSDVAGSIRYPAHCCGVFGLRPSHHFVRFDDIGPILQKKSFANLAVAGPIARSIKDIQLVLSVLTQTHPITKPKKKLTIGYTLEWTNISTDEISKKLIHEFISNITADGHHVSEINPKIDFKLCDHIYGIILGYEYKKMIPWPLRLRPFMDIFNYFFNTRRLRSGIFKESFEKGLFANKKKYLEALELAQIERLKFENEMNSFDLWLTPVSVSAAIKHQKIGVPFLKNDQQIPYASYLGHFLTVTALFHHPILSAPIGRTTEGLAVGVQLHGKINDDGQLLEDCSLLENYFLKPQFF